MALTRTAKSCGSDAPMLASSLREEAQMTVSNKLVTGKSTKETVKPLRGECRVYSGVPVVTTLVCSLHLSHARLWVHWAPGIPCALYFAGRMVFAKLGRIAPREREIVFEMDRRHCEERLVRRSSTSE